MVMVWLEGGHGEVRGASHPPKNCPTWNPRPQPTLLTPPITPPKPPLQCPPRGGLQPTSTGGGGGSRTKTRRRPTRDHRVDLMGFSAQSFLDLVQRK